MEQAVFLKQALETVIARGQLSKGKFVQCKKCRASIEYIATKMRVWQKDGKGFVFETKTFVNTIQVLCPKCDGRNYLVSPGGIVYEEETVAAPPTGGDWEVAPGLIEHGHFTGAVLPIAKRVVVRVTKVELDENGVEAHLIRMRDPLYAIKWRHVQQKKEKERLKELEIARTLELWGCSSSVELKEEEEEVRETPKKKKFVTVKIDGMTLEVEI